MSEILDVEAVLCKNLLLVCGPEHREGRLTFNAKIQDLTPKLPPDQSRLAAVRVSATCEKTDLDMSEGLSNDKGEFDLHGGFWGELKSCRLSFAHPRFKVKVLELNDAIAEGFMRVWKVNVELEPL